MECSKHCDGCVIAGKEACKDPYCGMPWWMRHYTTELQEPTIVLAGGQKSRFYIDVKGLLLDAGTIQGVVRMLLYSQTVKIQPISQNGPNLIGMGLGGTLMVMSLAENARRTFIIRKESQSRGLKKRVEGCAWRGPVILLEDVITTGGSVFRALNTAKYEGFTIDGVVCFVDRGGAANVREAGYQVESVCTFLEPV